MRRMNVPPFCRAKSQLNRAVRTLPICSCPVGEGAKRTRTFWFWLICIHGSKRESRAPEQHELVEPHLICNCELRTSSYAFLCHRPIDPVSGHSADRRASSRLFVRASAATKGNRRDSGGVHSWSVRAGPMGGVFAFSPA